MKLLELLGLASDAQPDEVERAFKIARSKTHPDKGGDPEMFQALLEAYRLHTKTPCVQCSGKGFITIREGFFSKKTECPICWKKQ